MSNRTPEEEALMNLQAKRLEEQKSYLSKQLKEQQKKVLDQAVKNFFSRSTTPVFI